MHSDDPIAPVGYLKLNKLRLDTKLPIVDLKTRMSTINMKDSEAYVSCGEEEDELPFDSENEDNNGRCLYRIVLKNCLDLNRSKLCITIPSKNKI